MADQPQQLPSKDSETNDLINAAAGIIALGEFNSNNSFQCHSQSNDIIIDNEPSSALGKAPLEASSRRHFVYVPPPSLPSYANESGNEISAGHSESLSDKMAAPISNQNYNVAGETNMIQALIEQNQRLLAAITSQKSDGCTVKVPTDAIVGEEQDITPSLDDLVESAVTTQTVDDEENDDVDVLDSLQGFLTSQDKCGPPINPDLAKVINGTFQSRVNEEKTKSLMGQYFRPENCDNFVVPRVNTEVWPTLKKRTQDTDAKLQRSQNYLLKGLVPTTQLLDKLLVATKAGKGLDHASTKECLQLANDAFKLLQTTFTDISYRRRYFLRTDLRPCYKALCNDDRPITHNLLGDDLEVQLKQMDTTQKLSHKIQQKAHGNHGYSAHPYKSAAGTYRPRGHNYGSRPYNHGPRTAGHRHHRVSGQNSSQTSGDDFLSRGRGRNSRPQRRH